MSEVPSNEPNPDEQQRPAVAPPEGSPISSTDAVLSGAEDNAFVDHVLTQEEVSSRLRRAATHLKMAVRGQAAYAPFEVIPREGQEVADDLPQKVDLIRLPLFKKLPNGTQLTSIDGKRVTKGRDEISNDTRGGFMSVGLPSRAPKGIKNNYIGPRRFS